MAEETLKQIADFAAQKIRRMELALSGGGWLRLKRVPSGVILLRYRVGQPRAGAGLEGAVCLEPEPAERFCRELRGLS